MATDTRANRLAAPDYIYIRLVIASMFVRNHICEPKSAVTQRFGCVKAIKKTLQRLIRLLYVDFAPRAPSSSACIFSINLRAGRQEQENIRGGTQEQQNAWVLLDRDPTTNPKDAILDRILP